MTDLFGAKVIAASAVLVLVCPVALAADLYKCTDADGRTVYQDGPCARSDHSSTVVVPDTPEQLRERRLREARQVRERERQEAIERINKQMAERQEKDRANAAERAGIIAEAAKRWPALRAKGVLLRKAQPGQSLSSFTTEFSPERVNTVRTNSGEHRYADYCLPIDDDSQWASDKAGLVTIHSLNGVIVSVSSSDKIGCR